MRRREDRELRACPAAPPAPRRAGAAVVLAALVGTVLALLLGAAPASAHASFAGSDPAEGARLATLPDAVVMSYSEDVAPQFVETAVVAPDGTTVPTEAAAEGPDVTVDLAGADLPALAGAWQVVARVVSVDGHPVEHTTSLVVEQAAAPDPAETPAAPAPEPTNGTAGPTAGSAAADGEASAASTDLPADPAAALGDALPRWVVVAGAAALVLAAAAALLVQLRRRPPAG